MDVPSLLSSRQTLPQWQLSTEEDTGRAAIKAGTIAEVAPPPKSGQAGSPRSVYVMAPKVRSGIDVRQHAADYPKIPQRFSFEQLLVIVGCLYVTAGHHGRTGDKRPLKDIIQRDQESWQESWMRGLDKDSWESFASAYTSIVPGAYVSIEELQQQLHLILSELKQLAGSSPVQKLGVFTSAQFSWENNIHLVCLSLAVTSTCPKFSRFWSPNEDDLANMLSSSSLFPYIPTKDALHSAMQDLRLLFNAPEPTMSNSNWLQIPSTVRKRPSDEDLGAMYKSVKGAV